MKHLYLIRHAKSSWKDETLADFDRPLNKRGRRNAVEMGEFLSKKSVSPDAVLASPAIRSKTTAELLTTKINFPPEEIFFSDRLYMADMFSILELIKSQNDDIESLMIFGHNPGFQNLAQRLFEKFEENLPTCGTLYFRFDCNNWAEIAPQNAKLVFSEFPKNLVSE